MKLSVDKAQAITQIESCIKAAPSGTLDFKEVELWSMRVFDILGHLIEDDENKVAKYVMAFDANKNRYSDDRRTYIKNTTVGLRQLEAVLESLPAPAAVAIATPAASKGARRPAGGNKRRVFLVHGRNMAVARAVESFLWSNGLEPIVIADQPARGRTIIELIEQHSDVEFALILMSGDDLGCLAGEEDLRKRARQNVVLELGYFVGLLGRAQVAVLCEADLELPSDVLGVRYTAIDDDWKYRLLGELKAASVLAS
jgi:predicted nucleotide-binding protein